MILGETSQGTAHFLGKGIRPSALAYE